MNGINKNPFDAIYETHEWEGESHSGPGSDPERTHAYRVFLERFMADHAVRSVVDLGCGDWASSQLVDWSGIDYLGLDVVPSVVARNRSRFGSQNIRFEVIDPAAEVLPKADLLIVKEVLQHLPNDRVHQLLNASRAYKYALLTNDVSHEVRGSWRRLWLWRPAAALNVDTQAGGYRLLDLRDPPFNFAAREVLRYENRYAEMRWTKQVLLHTRRDFA